MPWKMSQRTQWATTVDDGEHVAEVTPARGMRGCSRLTSLVVRDVDGAAEICTLAVDALSLGVLGGAAGR